MDKIELRKILRDTGVRQWQIAERMGIREDKLSKMLRHELSPEDEAIIRKAVTDIITDNNRA